MNVDDPVIKKVIENLMQFSPRSIFVYGSRGRGDFNVRSDYEIGAVFNADSYTERAVIHKAIDDPTVKVYPFKWEDLVSGNIKIVFQKSMYLKELKLGAKMLYGDDVIKEIPNIPITVLDLLQRTRFDIGLALASLLSYRSNDMDTSMEEFTKSCLFGLRSLIIFELKKFPIGYDEIYEMTKELDIDNNARAVVEAAISYRRDGSTPGIDTIYENISLLDSLIEPRLVEEFNRSGNAALL